jgi:hypothetical protein
MKTIRLIALIALVAAGACAQTPTAPETSASGTEATLNGTGFAGSGT